MGWVALPNIVMFHFLLPLVSPLIDLVFLLGVVDYLISQNSPLHTAGHYSPLLKLSVAFIIFLLVDFTAAGLAVGLERCSADRRNNLRLLGPHLAAAVRISAFVLAGDPTDLEACGPGL